MEIREKNKAFDLATGEQDLRRRARWLNKNEPLQLWEAMRDALVAADDYLRKRPIEGSIFAEWLDVVLSALVPGNRGMAPGAAERMTPENDFTVQEVAPFLPFAPLRDRLKEWRRPQLTRRAELRRYGRDVGARTWFVRRYHASHDDWWWKGKPTPRDLAILTLLAGCEPGGVHHRQRNAGGEADLPTPPEVIEAEERAVNAVLSRLRKKTKATTP